MPPLVPSLRPRDAPGVTQGLGRNHTERSLERVTPQERPCFGPGIAFANCSSLLTWPRRSLTCTAPRTTLGLPPSRAPSR